jgi:predicted amidohydrolase
MKQRMVRVSAVQLPANVAGRSFVGRQRKNRSIVLEMLRTAGERRSDLVLLGEYANLCHRTWSEKRSEYVPDPIPGHFVAAVGRMARRYRMNVVLPILGRHRGVLGNYAVVLDRKGEITGLYLKSHTTVPEQRYGMTPGNDLPVFRTDVARIGIMTCMDIEYPEVAQVLMLRGAELLLFPHVQGSWGEIDWEIRYRARAIDTGLPVVSACHGTPEGEWLPGKMIGRTSVIGRDGLVLADLGRGVGVLTVDLDLEAKRRTVFYFPEANDRTLAVTASRRPELYGELTSELTRVAALARLRIATRARRSRTT